MRIQLLKDKAVFIKIIKKYQDTLLKLIAFFMLILMLAGYGFFIYFADRGFDITDESFYLLNAFYPEDVVWSMMSFEIYLNIFSRLLGGSVYGIRVLCIVILLFTSCLFGYQIISFVRGTLYLKYTIWESLVYISIISFSALAYYGRLWLITPSYNWLSLISSMLVGIGMLMTLRLSINTFQKNIFFVSKYFWIGTFLIGTGGALSFHAKPLSTLFLGFFAVLWLLIFLPINKYIITFISAFFFFLCEMLMHIYLFDGGFQAYYKKIKTGLLFGDLLGSGHTPEAVFDRSFTSIINAVNPFGFYERNSASIIILGFALVVFHASKKFRLNDKIKIFACKIFMVGSFVILINHKIISSNNLNIGQIGIDLLIYILLFLFVNQFVNPAKEKREILQVICGVTIISALGIFFLFGTKSKLIYASGAGYVFYIAGFVVGIIWVARDYGSFFRLTFASFTLIPLIIIILHGYKNPYRLPEGIQAQIHPVSLMGSTTKLFVDERTEQWISSLQAIALKSGWKNGNYIIDMTGGTPGATVVLCGRFPGTAWLLGGYPGSDEFAKRALSLVSHDILIKAWILTAPNGTRKISLEVLKSNSIPFPESYKLVGAVKTGHREEEQLLWKPLIKE